MRSKANWECYRSRGVTVNCKSRSSARCAHIFNLLDWTNLTTTNFASRYNAGSYSGLILENGGDNLGFDLPDISGSGFGWDISQFVINGTIAVALVPEPSRVLLLAAGLGMIFSRRHRRMTKNGCTARLATERLGCLIYQHLPIRTAKNSEPSRAAFKA